MSDSIEMPLHTATWRGVLPIYKKLIQVNGNTMVDNIAHHELYRMADAADMFGKFTRALQEVEDVLSVDKIKESTVGKALKLVEAVLDEAKEVAKEGQPL